MTTATQAPLGIVRGMPAAEYHADPGVSSTLLRKFRKSAKHARHEMLHGSDSTPGQEIGTAIHAAILEPELFERAYVRGPRERRTKAGKDAFAALQAAGVTVFKEEVYDKIIGARDAVLSDETAGPLIASARERELSVFWEERGRRCKARIDILTTFVGWTWWFDLKCSGDGITDASQEGFAKAIANHEYHVQNAWYGRALEAVAPHPRRCGWIAVEPDPPHGVGVYEASEAMLAQGAVEAQAYFDRLLHAEETGRWPGYTSGIHPIDLPRWAQRGSDE